ncbi:guanine nucleotide exchange protein smcr8b [Mugil cephalus]|uniref:guanine nucleotide exchange protein smcr8b n=1 Tax=Mugil cephalus TaxID=48193 RepID=UPI001FB6A60D|nr:guanine nucleotide exchange protein smcr8b [Mugil cephalus]
MIGSPDLLAFTGTEGFGEREDVRVAQGLPEDLSVPLLPSCHPWTTSAQFNRDFILVAEFSEQVGPKPVLTIPDDPRVIGSFDLNHFSVRIMSVDYQASGPGHTPPSTSGPRLNFSEDSKVILGDSAEDAFAYVHHVTLYDLEARGMVRPFCMAYVCSDQAKLMENFSELSTRFSQASDSLKTGNRQAFSMELQRKLQELEYRRLTLLQDAEHQRTPNGLPDVEEKDDELEAVEHSISTHRDLLRQITSYPNRKLKEPDFLPYDPADSLTDPMSLQPPEPCASFSTFTSCRSELKSLQELCNSYFLSLMKEQLADTERRLRGDKSALRTTRLVCSLSRRLKLTGFLFEPWSPEDVEEDERESDEVELQGTAGAKRGDDTSQSQPLSLESFYSCVEEIPIKLEAREAGTVTPDPSAAAEMTGSVSSGDSIEVLGTEKSYRTQHVVTGSDSRDAAVGVTDAVVRRAGADVGVKRVQACARRANSEDSIEVLSTTESIFPDDLTAITEEEAEPLTNGVDNEEEPRTGGEESTVKAATVVNENDEPGQEDEDGADREECAVKLTDNAGVVIKAELDAMNHVHEDGDAQKTSKLWKAVLKIEVTPPSPEVHQEVRPGTDLHVNYVHAVSLSDVDHWSPPGPPLRLLSIDEASDCTSFTGYSEPPSPTQNFKSSPCLKKKTTTTTRRKAGLRALRFIKQHSFSQHAVFCLLSGRPLVVIGGDETLLRKLVDALSLFLPAPGPGGGAVMPCLTRPLLFTDLLTWRLIGIHRSSSISSAAVLHSLTRYSRYLSLLDLDQRTLRSPSYSGSLIGRMTDAHSGFRRGVTYLLHLESCLTALTSQVLLYMFTAAFRRPRAAGAKGGTEEDPQCTGGPCSSESDLRVMHFLSDLITQRHAGRGPPVLGFSYSLVHLHRNTYAA